MFVLDTNVLSTLVRAEPAALALDAILVTANREHLLWVPGLDIESWQPPRAFNPSVAVRTPTVDLVRP